MIEITGDKADIEEALISFAYRLLKAEHPSWYQIPETDVARLINEEPGIFANIF